MRRDVYPKLLLVLFLSVSSSQIHAVDVAGLCRHWLGKLWSAREEAHPVSASRDSQPYSASARERLVGSALDRYEQELRVLAARPNDAGHFLSEIFAYPPAKNMLISRAALRIQADASEHLDRVVRAEGGLGSTASQNAWRERVVQATLDNLETDLRVAKRPLVEERRNVHFGEVKAEILASLEDQLSVLEPSHPEVVKIIRDAALAHDGAALKKVIEPYVRESLESSSPQKWDRPHGNALLRDVLWDRAGQLAGIFASNAEAPMKAAASAARKKSETGGPYSRAAHRVARLGESDLKPLIETDIRGILNEAHLDQKSLVEKLDEVHSRTGEYYRDRFFDDLLHETTERSLEEIGKEYVARTVREMQEALAAKTEGRPFSRSLLKPNTLRTYLGPQVAKFEMEVWKSPTGQRDRVIRSAAEKIHSLPPEEVERLKPILEKHTTRPMIRAELAANAGQLNRHFQEMVAEHLLASGRPPTEGEVELLRSFEDGALTDLLFKHFLSRELASMVEIKFHDRGANATDIDYLEAMLPKEQLDSVIRFRLLPWASSRGLPEILGANGRAVMSMIGLLLEHGKREREAAEDRGELQRRMVADRAIEELSRARADDFAWAFQEEVAQLAELGSLTKNNFDAFLRNPERFLDVSRLYKDLFVQEESIPGGINNEKLLRDMYSRQPKPPQNTVTVGVSNHRLLFSVGEIVDPVLKDRFESVLRAPAQDYLIRATTECAKWALRDLPTDSFSMPVAEAVSLVERYIDGSGRGARSEFHYNGSNRASPAQYLTLLSVGFFKNETDRNPIAPQVTALLRDQVKSAVPGPEINYPKADGLNQAFWGKVQAELSNSLRERQRARAVRLQLVSSNLGPGYRASVAAGDWRFIGDLDRDLAVAEFETAASAERVNKLITRIEREARLSSSSDFGYASLKTPAGTHAFLVNVPSSLVDKTAPAGIRIRDDQRFRWYFEAADNVAAERVREMLAAIPKTGVSWDAKNPRQWLVTQLGIPEEQANFAVYLLPDMGLKDRIQVGIRKAFRLFTRPGSQGAGGSQLPQPEIRYIEEPDGDVLRIE